MDWKKVAKGAAAVWMGAVVVNEARLKASRDRSSTQGPFSQKPFPSNDIAYDDPAPSPNRRAGTGESSAASSSGWPSPARTRPEPKGNPMTVGNPNVGIGQWDYTKNRWNR